MDFSHKNMIAINFIHLNEAQKCEILAVRNDENIRKFMLDSKIIDKKTHFTFIKSLKNTKNMSYFAVYTKSDSSNLALLGVVCFNKIDLLNKNAFFGIYSVPNARNGANLLEMLEFIAFETLNLHILYAKVLSTNTKALRFYKKHHFLPCGKMIEAIKYENRFIDIEIFYKINARQIKGELLR